MSGKKNKAVVSTANIDAVSLAELQAVSELGVYDDLGPLVTFIKRGLLLKVLSNFGHFAAASDISKISQTVGRLATVLEVINFILHEAPDENITTTQAKAKLEFLEQRDRIAEFYTEVIQHNLKHFYKIFALRKPSAINPSLRVLLALVQYNNHSLFADFTDAFDFNHSSLMKLLIPTKDDFERKLIVEKSMRLHFMNFYMAVAAKTAPILRKSLLTNFKIMNNFWKYMEMDRYEILIAVIEFIDKSVLSEPLLRRISKCQILNENFLFKFSSLFAFVKPENDRVGDEDEDEFSRFKSSFTTLMNTLVVDQEKGIAFPVNEFGSPLTVNNRTFKINNKLLYTLLTALRPWEHYTQLQYVMTILNHNSELVPPYMNWIVSSSEGYHDPSLSAYWIGHTLLYSEILKSEALPADLDYVSLQPLSAAALTSCLAFTNDLVKQMGLQLILLMLNKLARGKASQSIIDAVLSNLPPQASYIPLLSHTNDIIKFTATSIIRSYEQLAPSFSSAAIVSTVKESLAKLDLEGCSKKDLVLLDHYLAIQSNNDLKWWSKSPKGHCFFTSLLKLSNIEFLKSKIFAILSKLLSTSIVFNSSQLIDSPLYSLVEATSQITDSPSAEKLWNCLDETISRAIKTPYKYLDKAHTTYSDLSVFFLVLFEQFKFIPGYKTDADLSAWLSKFVTDSIILGEPRTALEELAKASEISVEIKLDQIKPKDNLTTKFEFAQQLYVFNKEAQRAKNDSKLFDQIGKLGSFLMSVDTTQTSLVPYISDPKRWFFGDSLATEITSKTQLVAITLVAELLRQIPADLTASKLNLHLFDLGLTSLPVTSQKLLSKFMWIFTDEQIVQLSQNLDNEYVLVNALRLVIERKLDLSPDLIALSKIQHPDIKALLKKFEPTPQEYEAFLANKDLHYLLERSNASLVEHILNRADVDEELLYRVASTSKEVIERFQARVVQLALSMSHWTWSIKIFGLCPEAFDFSQVIELILSTIEKEPKLGFSTDFVIAVSALAKKNPEHQHKFNTWFHKCMLYITKKFAESEELSTSFLGFLEATETLLVVLKNPWHMCPPAIINTQLEVFLNHSRWVLMESCARYVNKLILCSDKKKIKSDKLLQIYLNNSSNPLNKIPTGEDDSLRFESALLIYKLFNNDIGQSSLDIIADQILTLYLGSTRADDLLLKGALKAIEKKTNKSWVNKVTGWDFSESLTQNEVELVGEERLIIKGKGTFLVALKKSFIQNSIAAPTRPISILDSQNYSDFVSLYHECLKGPYRETEYDPEFLLLVILNNDELISEKEGVVTFNVRRLIESKIFHVLVSNLSNPYTKQISRVLLHGMMKFVQKQEASYKDKALLSMYLSSILHTLRVAEHQTPVVWNIIASMAEIIINPGHFLYDRVCQYLLTNPIFKAYEIPLLYGITNATTHGDLEEDNYYKHVAWMVDRLIEGTKNIEDLNALRLKGVMEWALNLTNVEYVTGHLRHKLYRLLYQVQNVGGEGGDMLITKTAALSAMEAAKLVVPDNFSGEQLALNIDQISTRLGVLAQTKRLREWTSDDVARAVKRIHSS